MEDWNWETIFYGHYRSIFDHCDIIGLKIYRIRWKKRKIKAITMIKVIEVGTNPKPVCDFLLKINSNWQPISYRFGVISAYCSNFEHCVFEPMGGLGTMYDVYLGLIGKSVVDFLLVSPTYPLLFENHKSLLQVCCTLSMEWTPHWSPWASSDTVSCSFSYHTWQFIIFTIFTITACIFCYSLSVSFWTQDLALQQILSSIDLFLSYRTDYTDSRTI